jgi:predicted DNA-binding transcriptional regulator AlpA
MLKTNNGDIIGNVPERTDRQYEPDRFLKIDAVCNYCGDSNPRTIDRWMEEDEFPRPFYVRKTRFWQFSEVVAWFNRQPKETDIDDARREVFAAGRKKGMTPEARQKAAKTKRRRTAASAEVAS